MWLLLAFIAVPLIEIALFIQVGGLIGLGWTLVIVLFTAFLGAHLVRSQGAREMNRLRQSFSTLSDPAEPLANGAMILLAGALLLTPGFFTDACGFALLVPQIRSAVFHWLRKRVKVQSFDFGTQTMHRPQSQPEDSVIDGDFTEVDPDKRQTHPSGWTRH
mgnify:CR=1 FL=1